MSPWNSIRPYRRRSPTLAPPCRRAGCADAGPRGQIDLLLAECRNRREGKNTDCPQREQTDSVMVVSSHCFLSFLGSVGLVNHKFTGIHQHHHQHAAGENIVRRNLALVVRVPHVSPAALVVRVALRVSRLETAGRPRSPGGRIRTEIGAAAIPRAVGEDVRVGSVAGPPLATSPNGATCSGLLWSWHHS